LQQFGVEIRGNEEMILGEFELFWAFERFLIDISYFERLRS
jgi:hypothetical protein